MQEKLRIKKKHKMFVCLFPIFLQKFSMTKEEKRILYNFSHKNIRVEWPQWHVYGSAQLHSLVD